jgi:hypothetical protein
MIKIDCSELSGDVKLALAESVSEGLRGSGIALLDGNGIAVDQMPGRNLQADEIGSLVRGFFSSRKDAKEYSFEREGEVIVVHSVEPVPKDKKRVSEVLPPNLFQCPVCGFVSTSKEEYEDHIRMHDYIRGL